MDYRGRKQGSNYSRNHKSRHGKGTHPFPKKQLNQLLEVERKLDNLQGNIDLSNFDNIRNDVLEADSKVWKAIDKADKTRGD